MAKRCIVTLEPIATDPDHDPLTVSYLEWQPDQPARETVVLLHGGGFDSASLSWAEVGPELAAVGHRVVAPDHPGYGVSPLPRWRSTQQNLLGYLDRFLPAVAGDRYVLGGLSMGGALTLGTVLRRPEGIRGIMLLGSGGLMTRQRPGRFSLPIHLVTWLSVHSGLMRAAFDWSGRSRRFTQGSMPNLIRNPSVQTDALVDEILATAHAAPAVAFTQWQRDQILPTRIRDDYTAQLGAVHCPALVVHGERDPGVLADHGRKAAAALPHGELLMVPDAAHWVQRDRPDIVVPAMINFLDRLDGGDDATATDS